MPQNLGIHSIGLFVHVFDRVSRFIFDPFKDSSLWWQLCSQVKKKKKKKNNPPSAFNMEEILKGQSLRVQI